MKLYLKILIHVIFWMVYFLFSTALGMTTSGQIVEWSWIVDAIPHLVINFIWALVVFYLFYFYFIRFFESRKFILYLLFSILTSICVTLIFMPVHKLFVHFNMFNYRVLLPPMAGTFILAQCGSLVGGFENWFTSATLKAELENRNLRNELELLKSQINPHFLFNTLNNIDSLIRTSPEDASSSLIKLSDMLRYMIYETKPDKVLLEKEIEYLRNYIGLQQLRFRNKEYVKMSFSDQCHGYLIVPMLFVPFVENAFKYASDRGELPVIEISLQCNGSDIVFCCQNYFGNEILQNSPQGGVGLSNVKRRLELLYPGKYTLIISDEKPIFKVDLMIKLE